MSPVVSIVVPTFREGPRLLDLLTALDAQTYPRELIEVLVIDNTPDFELAGTEVSTRPGVRLLHQAKPGSYAARNRGLAAASGAVIGFTDGDCLPAPDWITAGVAVLDRHGDALVAGPITVFPRDPRRPAPAELIEALVAFPQETYVRHLHFGATANVFTTRNVIQTVGGFNEDSYSGGDLEFGQRVHAAGYPVVYAPDVRVQHPARPTLKALLAKRRRTVRGVAVLETVGQVPAGTRVNALLRDLRPPIRRSLALAARRDARWLSRAGAIAGLWAYKYVGVYDGLRGLVGDATAGRVTTPAAAGAPGSRDGRGAAG
jgi:GT2 family glycosyltransferase